MPDHASSHTTDAAAASPARFQAMLSARAPLIAGEAFGAKLPADAVLAAIARGAASSASAESDLCPLPVASGGGAASLQRELEQLDFDRRMRASSALVIAVARLSPHTLAGSATFEVATRARQAGVPCYAVTAVNELSTFDERILDLQVVLLARDPRTLTLAGRKLGSLVAHS